MTTAAGTAYPESGWSRDDFTVEFAPGRLKLSPSHGPASAPVEVAVTMDGINPSHVGSIWLLRDGEEPQRLAHSQTSPEGSFKVTLPPGAPGETVRLQARADGGSWEYGRGASLNGDGDLFRWDGAGAYSYGIKGQVSLKTLVRGSFGVTGSVDLEIAADGSVHGPLTLNDASARLVSGGFLPITAKLAFVPSGEAVGAFGPIGLWLDGKFRLKVKELKLFGAIPLIGGNTCQTKQLTTIGLGGPAFTVPDGGGRLTGTFTLSDLNGCGALNGLVSPLTAGAGNTLTLDLTPRS